METYVVRVWRPADGDHLVAIRGMAIHVGSGRRILFADPGRLIDFLGDIAAGEERSTAAHGSSESPDQE